MWQRGGPRHLVGRRQLGVALVAGVAGDEPAVRQLVEPLVELHTRVHLRTHALVKRPAVRGQLT
jgi:hypothetical protein